MSSISIGIYDDELNFVQLERHDNSGTITLYVGEEEIVINLSELAQAVSALEGFTIEEPELELDVDDEEEDDDDA